MIGRKRQLRLADKEITQLVVDPDCPTVRNIRDWQRHPSLESVARELNVRKIEKLLVTPTNPVYLVVVYSTYPKFLTIGFFWEKDVYAQFIRECEIRADAEELKNRPVWMTEGF